MSGLFKAPEIPAMPTPPPPPDNAGASQAMNDARRKRRGSSATILNADGATAPSVGKTLLGA